VAKPEPLTPAEDLLWRSLIRIVISLPRHLDADLVRNVGLTSNEYIVLMHLSEAPKRELRMSELANAAALSASRMTRLVDGLESRGLVARRTSSEDGRGFTAKLTPDGMSKVRLAWPAHLASVRERVMDHIDAATVAKAAEALSSVASTLGDDPTRRISRD
jgi:DNA-binding MarR family transcriptional regulator